MAEQRDEAERVQARRMDRPIIPRVLAGVLRIDERQFDSCIEGLLSQQDCDVSYQVFGHFNKREASRRLYASLGHDGETFDVRCRLDADMVIVHPRLFSAAASVFSSHPNVDTITVGLHDFFTDSEIKGLHLWSPRVRWLTAPPWLFGDAVIDTSRWTLTVTGLTQPLVLHSPDPGPEQALRYGSHRALKGLMRGPHAKRWKEFLQVADAFGREPDPRRALAIAAALDAMTGPALADHIGAVTGTGFVRTDRILELARSDGLLEQFRSALSPERLAASCEERSQAIEDLLPSAHGGEGSPRRLSALRRRASLFALYRLGAPPDGSALREEFLSAL